MITDGMLEKQKEISEELELQIILGKFERSKILEIYFARFDGRVPEVIPGEYAEIYKIELKQIKEYLLGQKPQDQILRKIFQIMN